jgi:hypothetical protein
MSKRGGIADFAGVGSLADPVGPLSMTEVAPYFVKNVSKVSRSLDSSHNSSSFKNFNIFSYIATLGCFTIF